MLPVDVNDLWWCAKWLIKQDWSREDVGRLSHVVIDHRRSPIVVVAAWFYPLHSDGEKRPEQWVSAMHHGAMQCILGWCSLGKLTDWLERKLVVIAHMVTEAFVWRGWVVILFFSFSFVDNGLSW